jgi:acetyl esterase/lipase
MEIKEWTYEAFPAFDEEIEGVEKIATTGDEIGVRYIPDVTYAQIEGTSLTLQILRPYTRNHHDSVVPCVLYVQGSGWMKQDLYGQIPALSKLAERGYVVALVEYRHSGIATFPAQVLDARNALRFMRVHAEEYKIDADNMFIAGDSSGGHTAMFAGMMHHDDRLDNLFPGVSAEVRGIINWYGSVRVMLE